MRIAIVERGHGVPVVLIPEFRDGGSTFEPAFDALSTSCRAITYSLHGEPGSGEAAVRGDAGFDGLADQLDAVLDALELDRAVLCGVSFGGLFATAATPQAVASRRRPDPGLNTGPGFHLRPRQQIYARLPWVFGPALPGGDAARVGREIAAISPPTATVSEAGRTFLKTPLSLSRIAARARLIGGPEDSDRPPPARRGARGPRSC